MPDKYGMKSFMLCDSSNGFCAKFELYTGVRHEEPSPDGIMYDLVMHMMQPDLHCGQILCVDNYHTSPSLFCDLALAGTGATGTARRKFKPPNVTDLKLNEKERRKSCTAEIWCAPRFLTGSQSGYSLQPIPFRR